MTSYDERQELVESLHRLEQYRFEFRRILGRRGQLQYQVATRGGITEQDQQELKKLGKEWFQKNKELRVEFGIRRLELDAEIQARKRQLEKMDLQETELEKVFRERKERREPELDSWPPEQEGRKR